MLTEQKKHWKAEKRAKKARSKEARELIKEQKRVRRWWLYLQTKEFPGKTLLQLLGVILQNGSVLAGEMAVAQIESTNRDLSPDDLKDLADAKTQLAGRRNRIITAR